MGIVRVYFYKYFKLSYIELRLSNMMLQTIRKSIRATVLSSARQGLFFIPLIMILPYYLGLQGVEMCQAVADMLTFVLAIPLTGSVLLEMKRKETGR